MAKKSPDQNELAKKLLSRRSDLEDIVSECKVVDDVLAGRMAIVTRTSRKGGTGMKPGAMAVPGVRIPQNPNFATVDGSNYNVGVEESRYLPKRGLESAVEYQKRLDMTPFFAETPPILQARQGALFRKPPDVKLPDAIGYLDKSATMRGSVSLLDVIVRISDFSQTTGFCGVLLDRKPLPNGIDPSKVTVAQKTSQGLGNIVLALYAGHQVNDWGEDANGLTWVKVVEKHDGNTSWDGKHKEIWTVRIVDRKNTTRFDVQLKEGSDADYTVTSFPAIPHGFVDTLGQPVVPFRLFHPFPARDGIGRSNLRASAEADVAATRMLSELVWMLHMCAPLCVVTTNRPDADIPSMKLGSQFINFLKGKDSQSDAETIQFVQIDSTPIDKLAQAYDKLCNKAREQANKSEDAGVTGPTQQSGISKAWTFKTGEERVLFLISVCLQEGLQWLLELAAVAEGADPATVSIIFPQNYDVTGISEQLTIAEQVIALFDPYMVKTPILNVMEKVGLAAMGNADDATLAKFRAELKNVVTQAEMLQAQIAAAGGAGGSQAPQISIQSRIPITDGDSV